MVRLGSFLILTSDCTPHTRGTASPSVQYCTLPKGKQDYPTPKTVPTQQEKPGSAVRVAQVLVPWAGLDLGQFLTEKHQYDVLSGFLYLNVNGKEGGQVRGGC